MLLSEDRIHSLHGTKRRAATARSMQLAARLVLGAATVLAGGASVASAATLSRRVNVPGTPAQVWSLIGPFCAIERWLPPVGTCTNDGGRPPTRTLVTKDGTATFVERQTARSDRQHFYSYRFVSSPLPVSHYMSTIRVMPGKHMGSTVIWLGRYTPAPGKADAAHQALAGIYAAGLAAIRTQANAQFAPTATPSVSR
jgi:hypothetical protein